jgi:hypothetical protein
MGYGRFKQNFFAVSNLASNALNAPHSWLQIKLGLNPVNGKCITYISVFSNEFARNFRLPIASKLGARLRPGGLQSRSARPAGGKTSERIGVTTAVGARSECRRIR